jgi:hypothetical protein
MNDFEIGLGPDAHLRFHPQHHKGLGHVYPRVVRGGKPEVFSDWAAVRTQSKRLAEFGPSFVATLFAEPNAALRWRISPGPKPHPFPPSSAQPSK